MITKPFRFDGDELRLNFSTSAVGWIKVEVQDQAGQPLRGFSLADCPEIYGDELDGVVKWRKDADVGALAGKAVRLRFSMSDSNLYAFRFTAKDGGDG